MSYDFNMIAYLGPGLLKAGDDLDFLPPGEIGGV